jgi:hypothetical protein
VCKPTLRLIYAKEKFAAVAICRTIVDRRHRGAGDGSCGSCRPNDDVDELVLPNRDPGTAGQGWREVGTEQIARHRVGFNPSRWLPRDARKERGGNVPQGEGVKLFRSIYVS